MNHRSPDPVACHGTPAEELLRGWRTLAAAAAAFLAELREFDLQRGYRGPMPGAAGKGPATPRRTPRTQGQGKQAPPWGVAPGTMAGTMDSTAKWLQRVCGVDEADVREALRVAYKLLNLPRIEASFAAGELSYRKVRALTAVATAGTEAELLPFAVVMTDAQVAQYCNRLRERAAAKGECRAATGR